MVVIWRKKGALVLSCLERASAMDLGRIECWSHPPGNESLSLTEIFKEGTPL